ncbi:MAG: ergothioneine biosynthesis protein EgtB [Actinomycetota bacterium]|nr:MAG: ergothioneine biosynthesis protein EgtB [Actinomycetota bacterium]
MTGTPVATESAAQLLAGLAALQRARERTRALTDAVTDADLVAQHSPLMSPLVWDLAHIANQEELWLVRTAAGAPALVPAEVDDLYDAFRHPRRDRPTLPIMGPAEARDYAERVRASLLALADAGALDPDPGVPLRAGGFVLGMVAQHEQQHDETMLATHQLRAGAPVLHAAEPPPSAGGAVPAEVLVPAGSFVMGTSSDPWALDNERPAHRVELDAFWIDTLPVTNAVYTRFIEAGGYDDPRWWTAVGWAHRLAEGLSAPQFWYPDPAGWRRRRFGVDEPVPPDEPVLHVCFHEAAAYARWAGRRLPTEAEWEKAARHDPATGSSRTYPWGEQPPDESRANLGQRHLRPAAVGAYPAGASAYGVHQLLGDVWEWTASGFDPYPGFVAFPYDEYSKVFFGGDFRVLRGGSFGTDPVACRGTFRNWDLPIRRQIFSGFRTARDAGPGDAGGVDRTARDASPGDASAHRATRAGTG